MYTFHQLRVESTETSSLGVNVDNGLEQRKHQSSRLKESQELKVIISSQSPQDPPRKPMAFKKSLSSVSFVERARLDLQAHYIYVHSHYFMGRSVYANRMQVANMISMAIDRAVETQCDEVLEHAYQHAIAVILPNWQGKKSQLHMRLEQTLKDLGTGRVRFRSAREERYLSDIRHLKEKISVLEIALSEKVTLNKQLQDQNQKLWAQNRMLHTVLSQCADKLGIEFSLPADEFASKNDVPDHFYGPHSPVSAEGSIGDRVASSPVYSDEGVTRLVADTGEDSHAGSTVSGNFATSASLPH